MNDRDELAKVIESGYGEDPTDCPYDHAPVIADAVLAAGYRKPRTITTVRELEALTPGTRFLSHGIFYTRVGPSSRVRSEFGVEFYLSEFNYSGFTATVLHEPEADQ
jgi:hypothetical protein